MKRMMPEHAVYARVGLRGPCDLAVLESSTAKLAENSRKEPEEVFEVRTSPL